MPKNTSPRLPYQRPVRPGSLFESGTSFRVSGRLTRWGIFLAFSLGFTAAQSAETAQGAPPRKPAELFQTTRVWTVHLKATPEAWETMDPKGGGFGPSMFLAPVFKDQADGNKDGKLTAAEFRSLGEAWYGPAKAGRRPPPQGDQPGLHPAPQLR
jgi:hypothetical protein